jgi:hypothetical protein
MKIFDTQKKNKSALYSTGTMKNFFKETAAKESFYFSITSTCDQQLIRLFQK